jgi:hypothetical protein
MKGCSALRKKYKTIKSIYLILNYERDVEID